MAITIKFSCLFSAKFLTEHWEWSTWGACSVSCGFGVKARTPFCLDESINSDDCIPYYVPKTHEKQCFAGRCPGNCYSCCWNVTSDKVLTGKV